MSDAPAAPLLNDSPAPRLTGVQWLICAISAIGFAFDIYTLLMLPLIIKPALLALGGPTFTPGSEHFVKWARALFFVPAIAGGLVGLLGGYLTDILGRRRVLTGAILLYAFSAFAAGYATNLPVFLLLRCGMFIGVSVEFVAAVAWLAELFPNARQREKVLGYTQAFSSFGGLMVAGSNVMAANIAMSMPAIYGGHEAWRYTLLSGVIPALPLILIRPFLPESPVWQQKKSAGVLKRPSVAALFSPALRKTTILTTLVFAASYGIAFGAIQQLPQILGAPFGHKEIIATANAAGAKTAAELAAKAPPPPPSAPPTSRAATAPVATGPTTSPATPATAKPTPGPSPAALANGKIIAAAKANASDEAVARVTVWQEIGGLFGRIALAILALKIVTRRFLLNVFQVPAMLIVPLVFWWLGGALQSDNLTTIKIAIFVCGFMVVSQFSFWGNYIPLVFPLHLRGTGESFAANIGGRILGTLAAWITLTFSASAPGTPPNPAKIALTGAIVAGCYALMGVLLSIGLPEPKGDIAHD